MTDGARRDAANREQGPYTENTYGYEGERHDRERPDTEYPWTVTYRRQDGARIMVNATFYGYSGLPAFVNDLEKLIKLPGIGTVTAVAPPLKTTGGG